MIVRLSLITLPEFVVFGSWFATLGLVAGDQPTLPFWDLSSDSTACRAGFFAGGRSWG